MTALNDDSDLVNKTFGWDASKESRDGIGLSLTACCSGDRNAGGTAIATFTLGARKTFEPLLQGAQSPLIALFF